MSIEQWIETGAGKYVVGGHGFKNLAAGAYQIKMSIMSSWIEKMELKGGEIKTFDEGVPKLVLEEARQFWARRDRYKQMGSVWQRGMILHGKPGCGKTITTRLIAREVINMNGLVFFVQNPTHMRVMSEPLATLEQNRPLMVITEDFDNLFGEGKEDSEEEIMQLLDGVQRGPEGVIYLATTNHLKKIPDRVRNRPSRFDKIFEIGYPEESIRRSYLTQVLPPDVVKNIDFEGLVQKSHSLSFAHLKEMAVGVYVFDLPVDQAVNYVRGMATEEESTGFSKK